MDQRTCLGCHNEESPQFQPFCFKRLFEKIGHLDPRRGRSEADLAAYVREWAKTDYHPVGTCKIGNDELAVVDAKLRVRGIEALRVCDSSVMPLEISANTNAPTIMIAERASDMILGRDVAAGRQNHPER